MGIKTAEPPPPEGVSVKEWDKMLQRGPKPKTKTAGELAFDELTEPGPLPTGMLIDHEKLGAVTDQGMLASAALLSGGTSTDAILRVYEELGGTYKHAFGQQMFDTKQMAGSPALQGGMQQRSQTLTPTLGVGSAPQQQQAPAAPKAPGSGGSGQTSAPSPTAAPAAAAQPSVTVTTG